MGGAIGDAIGSPIEFLSFYQIQGKYGGKGNYTFEEFGYGTGELLMIAPISSSRTNSGMIYGCY
ncbi:MAG: ADP-ribosylglycohydrolase family protein [Cytophagales bacterium]|nr:MAG: ADP-ribosylglycohydrolase family protein [Cytophagales bacterium]